VIAAVGLNVGEASGSATIALVDPKNVRLDVTVDESDIAKVESGQKATITFDSIAGKSFAGEVTGVAPSATITSGVATYSVAITIADPTGVRAGMTGNASIVYGEQANALLVPNRAVKTQGRAKTVDVVADGQKAIREVKVGISNEQLTEITEGLAEGEQVVISTTTSTQRPCLKPTSRNVATRSKPSASCRATLASFGRAAPPIAAWMPRARSGGRRAE
jgi:hypothetical protein